MASWKTIELRPSKFWGEGNGRWGEGNGRWGEGNGRWGE
eukprot:COSAG01_NODE_30068_length_624_cov_2.240458_1_plen_38_part_01